MREVNYVWRRSRRKTLSITVSEGRVDVKIPFGMPDGTVREFVEKHRSWIERKLQQYDDVRFASVRAGKTLLDAGVERMVQYGSPKSWEADGVFYLKSQRSVRTYFEKTRGWLLLETLHELSLRAGVTVLDVCLRDFKSRWGSCDAKGIICLNWRLSMLPPRLSEYVMLHELCHRKRLDHSAVFWHAVAEVCPDYAARRKELKAYSFLTLMYRGR